MPFKKAIQICGVYLLALTMLWVPAVSQAEMLSTQKTLQSLTSNVEKREWLTSMVLRKEAQVQLQEYGVSRAESLNRVNSGSCFRDQSNRTVRRSRRPALESFWR